MSLFSGQSVFSKSWDISQSFILSLLALALSIWCNWYLTIRPLWRRFAVIDLFCYKQIRRELFNCTFQEPLLNTSLHSNFIWLQTMDLTWKCHPVLLSVSFWGFLANNWEQSVSSHTAQKIKIFCSLLHMRLFPCSLTRAWMCLVLTQKFLPWIHLHTSLLMTCAPVHVFQTSTLQLITAISGHCCQLKSYAAICLVTSTCTSIPHLHPSLCLSLSLACYVQWLDAFADFQLHLLHQTVSSLSTGIHLLHFNRFITIFHNSSGILCTFLFSWRLT